MFTNILVPLDSSQLAEKAISPALTLAHAQQATLHLVSVATVGQAILTGPDEYGGISPLEMVAESHLHCASYLQAQQKHLQGVGIQVAIHVREGDAATQILDTAVAHHIDLIAMTTHGYTGMTRWLLGSVTEKVLHAAPCPVLVLRGSAPFRHILITLDGSVLAENALPPALALAELFGARVTLLRVCCEPPLLDSVELALMDTLEYGLRQHSDIPASQQVDLYLADLLNRCQRSAEVAVQTAVVEGAPADAILNYINTHQVDLVAMATHGRTGLRRWVFGSVTNKVLHHAETAMLIVRPPTDAPQ